MDTGLLNSRLARASVVGIHTATSAPGAPLGWIHCHLALECFAEHGSNR